MIMSRRQKVLVIDDSQQMHPLIQVRLRGLGVELISAYDGQTGLKIATEEPPDLILLDVNMPGMSGFEVCQVLKESSQTHDIPVIFLTGADESVNKVKGFDLGAVDYVTKPFDPAELCARVRAALNTKALMDLLTTQGQIDGLTGLHNRRYFDERLGQELAAGHRYERPVGLLMIDLDHFKSINDTFGHPKGDQVLRKFADVLTQTCRATDVTCRYGGEEFAVILPASTAELSQQCGVRVLDAVRKCPDFVDIIGRPVTASIGVACAVPSDRMAPAALVEAADKALYTAKVSGRNRIAAAEPVHSQTAV
jgi:diguanylate cyclase (GGDEF)-like protein